MVTSQVKEVGWMYPVETRLVQRVSGRCLANADIQTFICALVAF